MHSSILSAAHSNFFYNLQRVNALNFSILLHLTRKQILFDCVVASLLAVEHTEATPTVLDAAVCSLCSLGVACVGSAANREAATHLKDIRFIIQCSNSEKLSALVLCELWRNFEYPQCSALHFATV